MGPYSFPDGVSGPLQFVGNPKCDARRPIKSDGKLIFLVNFRLDSADERVEISFSQARCAAEQYIGQRYVIAIFSTVFLFALSVTGKFLHAKLKFKFRCENKKRNFCQCRGRKEKLIWRSGTCKRQIQYNLI